MSKQSIFGEVKSLPRAVVVQQEDFGNDDVLEFEEVDTGVSEIENVADVTDEDVDAPAPSYDNADNDPIGDALNKKLDEAIDAELEAEEAKLGDEFDEEYNDGARSNEDEPNFEFTDFLEAEFIIDGIDEFRQWAYPKGFDFAANIKEVKAYRKYLSLKDDKTPAEKERLKMLFTYIEDYDNKKLKLEDKIPWKEKYKANLIKYLNFQLNRVFENKEVSVLLMVFIVEAWAIGQIFMSKSSMVDLDFEIPDWEDKN